MSTEVPPAGDQKGTAPNDEEIIVKREQQAEPQKPHKNRGWKILGLILIFLVTMVGWLYFEPTLRPHRGAQAPKVTRQQLVPAPAKPPAQVAPPAVEPILPPAPPAPPVVQKAEEPKSAVQRTAVPSRPRPKPAMAQRVVGDCDPRVNFCWINFGRDVFATSREAAMRDREQVFREVFHFSPACVAAALIATETPGALIRLNVGDVLIVMTSGGFAAHRNTKIAFGPVRRGIEYSATAESWTILCEGQERQIILPEICYNWSYRTPPPTRQACATVEFDARPGDEVRWALLSRRPMPASGCWEICDGSECTSPQTPCDTCDWIGLLAYLPTDRKGFHTGRYTAHAVHQKVTMPLLAKDEYPAFCIDRNGAQSYPVAVEPNDWPVRGKAVYVISSRQWPVWGPFARRS